MDNEFYIDVELLSLGGNVSLMVIPRGKYFELFLEDQEFGRLRKDRDDNWNDVDHSLPPYSCDVIGSAIEQSCLMSYRTFKVAG